MDTTNINTNTDTNTNIHFFLQDLTEDKLEDNENMLQQLLQEFENQELDMNMNMGLSGNNVVIDELGYFVKKQLYTGNEELYYDEEYTIKDLMKICQYYGIAKNIKASKCKKSDIISTIIYFENSAENIEIINNRHKMWAYMTELLKDPKMKCFLLW